MQVGVVKNADFIASTVTKNLTSWKIHGDDGGGEIKVTKTIFCYVGEMLVFREAWH